MVRDFLNHHLPQRFRATSGIIIDKANALSPQTDVIVYDALTSPVYRYSEEMLMLPLDTVAAVIEVKSRLNKKEIEDGYEKIAECKRHKKTPVSGAVISTFPSRTPDGGDFLAANECKQFRIDLTQPEVTTAARGLPVPWVFSFAQEQQSGEHGTACLSVIRSEVHHTEDRSARENVAKISVTKTDVFRYANRHWQTLLIGTAAWNSPADVFVTPARW